MARHLNNNVRAIQFAPAYQGALQVSGFHAGVVAQKGELRGFPSTTKSWVLVIHQKKDSWTLCEQEWVTGANPPIDKNPQGIAPMPNVVVCTPATRNTGNMVMLTLDSLFHGHSTQLQNCCLYVASCGLSVFLKPVTYKPAMQEQVEGIKVTDHDNTVVLHNWSC